MPPQLLFVFGATPYFSDQQVPRLLAELFPQALRIGCSTAGEITGAGVSSDSCVVTAVRFEQTPVREAVTALAGMEDSRDAGVRLARQLTGAGLKAVMVFGQGVKINGSALLQGMVEVLGCEAPITKPTLVEFARISASDTAWMLAATALVILMTIPGLA